MVIEKTNSYYFSFEITGRIGSVISLRKITENSPYAAQRI
jgi:hypothetical protein